MKKLFILITIAVMCLIFIFSPISTADEKIEKTPLFTIRSYGDIVGVYDYGEDIPSKLTDIKISDLTPADRDLLNNGVLIYSKKELIEFLENFD